MLLDLRSLSRSWRDRCLGWFLDAAEPDEAEMYKRRALAALEDTKVQPLLGKRPSATVDTALRELERPQFRQFLISQCPPAVRRRFTDAEAALAEVAEKRRRVAAESEWEWRITCSLLVVASLALWATAGALCLLLAYLATSVMVFVLFWRGTAVWFNLRQNLLAAALGVVWLGQRGRLSLRAIQWSEAILRDGIEPVINALVRHLLGDDPDSVFIPARHRGLRAPRAPGFVVENHALQQLQRKLSHLEDGTIAICGPRGVGKSTLLEQSVNSADFGVLVQAPATYNPHDFLLALSVQLCQEYIGHEGYEAPQLTRLSMAHQLLRRLLMWLRRWGRWAAYALPAAALIALGVYAKARGLQHQYIGTVRDSADSYEQTLLGNLQRIWDGRTAGTAVVAIIIGVAWWESRSKPWLARAAAKAARGTVCLLGMSLVGWSLYTLFRDPQLSPRIEAVLNLPLLQQTLVVILLFLWADLRGRSTTAIVTAGTGRKAIHPKQAYATAASATGLGLLLFLISTPATYEVLDLEDNPLRMAGIIAGTLLIKLSRWKPRPSEPPLVTQCRNHLYRLQTLQMTTNTITPAAVQMVALGGSHASSVSTLPPNFPELVSDFRRLLRLIAREEALAGHTVVIAIDEVDRLGSDIQARAFLSEIKAILGVPHVYYLISVSEDVGAAFVRRGLPHRDVTDSSLDDIVHVQPSTLDESRKVLTERAPSLKDPYRILAHSLSGGILRDLLRYALQIEEIQDKIRAWELTEISERLIVEELAETLAGFRTLLSKHRWNVDTSHILTEFRSLCGLLRSPCTCEQPSKRRALEEFSFQTFADQHTSSALADINDDVRELLDEAAAYAYFSLTLLDVFSTRSLERRIQTAARQGGNGDLERLAEARQELSISPYSARPLINNIRIAWNLPQAPAPALSHLRVFGERRPCPLHTEINSSSRGRR
ncbi:hypothetical protein OYE22_31030 [Streptomyces sp. 71268]|uniref:hypothetical protein n=1 Tax=Streptomyces sp. 71268 TaxID=3002640 RepID=UPI0023F8B7C1|nr:hypothetical protein [Streptomyces sp. 71268]WEV29127.1 hypothetical protein OYE22_31030 [Streptomyces sp. 71268]